MDIDNILQSQKDYFLTQQTKNISFRQKCLKKLQTELIKRESDIIKALHDDF
jgi:aldehyde dehydrogenase (NAD+)